MKIERIETFLVPPRWLFCRVETDEGVVGWGEPVVEGRAEVVRAANSATTATSWTHWPRPCWNARPWRRRTPTASR
ncbi:hypothetical protein AB0D38_38170, partial [Streptomyces sp. NPDC048279]